MAAIPLGHPAQRSRCSRPGCPAARPPPRSGPAGSGSRPGPASARSRRCPESGPRCTSTPRSPCQSASRHTRRTRCAPGSPRPAPSARRHAARPQLRDLLLRPRRRRAGRLPPAGTGKDHPGTMAGHHHRVLPAGPGPRHGDRPGAHAPRRRDGHGIRTRLSAGPAPGPVRRPGPGGPGPVRSGPGGRHDRDRSAAPDQAEGPRRPRRCRPGRAA